ncbi:hypothetical protein MPTK1_3g01520 [Marchantia polymorpha subsp. ruderalis]|uniref:Uncharacterized protein n=2 Tax=Marchantia polymorpha TaxID=3197 RepID=A0AAF6AWC3_MARPO|nr:hypothetical protein MARPO_0007s0144 [Marchantia polymorpha]BBN04057.1 hypothetical protein Mp_3g01520 [Marchantia polymorpha subsp. ruderalis]|eukprot:PTQ47744.1 hypothetical protein MARPO_0007s0144 [Marchantia polymorpha]
MDKFIPGSPCPYHGSYTKSVLARYKDQAGLGAGAGVPGPAAQLQAHARKMEPIWDIVSGLAKSLTEARDQIATLMKQQQQLQQQQQGSMANLAAIERKPSPVSRGPQYAHNRCPPLSPAQRDHTPHGNRNVHRSHAHGFCAFGRNSEYKELMHHNAGGKMHPPPRYADQFQQSESKAAAAAKEREQIGRGGAYGIKLKGGGGNCGINVVPGSQSFTCRQAKGKKGMHLTAQMRDCHMKVDADGKKFDGENPVKIRITAPTKVRPPPSARRPSPEVRRYCVGTQYANLLKEEAHHLREQRGVSETQVKRANWTNY